MLELTEDVRDPGLREPALDTAMWVHLDGGELDLFDTVLAEQQTLTGQLGEPLTRFSFAFLRASRVLITCESMDEAQAVIDELLVVGQATGRADEATATWGTLALVLAARRGQLDEIAPLIEAATQLYPDLAAVKANLANLYCNLGRIAEAHQLIHEVLEAGLNQIPRDRIWLPTMALLADAVAELGLRDPASALYLELAPICDLVLPPNFGNAEGPVTYHVGRLATALGRFDDAEQHFAAAESLCRHLGAPYWLARNQLAHARMLDTRGDQEDRERARQLVDETLTIARRVGYGHVEAQAEELASRIG
jgi:tetratricopeptide (TPR) repeat protein